MTDLFKYLVLVSLYYTSYYRSEANDLAVRLARSYTRRNDIVVVQKYDNVSK